ncbi:MAG: MBL fold metallo-hydrolase [Candidatus Anammoximicrobium sp.]|nr:MBL fold metallo-hydrolase [Candidatus Anammoximicrobium sp.]
MSQDQAPCVTTRASRRDFLKASAAAAFAVGGEPWLAAAGGERPACGSTTRLSEHLSVYHGPINVGLVRDGDRALLIDCGDGRVADVLPELGVRSVAQVVFTHHHRDQACGASRWAASGAKFGVPESERELFADPAAYWNDDKNLWRVYASFRPHRLTLAEPVRVDEAYADGQSLRFGAATIRVLATPGHTDGSLSYAVEVDGRRVVFCGDCLYSAGRVWDVYSLQRGFSQGNRRIGGYHGFLGDRWRLVESLARLQALEPQTLVPSHGEVMSAPAKAIGALTQRFESCYENYVAISALRHYFPDLFAAYAGRPGQMPIRPGIDPPSCLRHFGTTWMLVSKTGAAFVMDVGSNNVVRQLQKMIERGEIKRVEGLWVTHYHFDHTDGIPLFQKEFDCPCFTDRRLADVLSNPRAWRLPCLAPEAVRVHRPMEDGQSWEWQEFKLTSYFFPGQTLYHAALLVEGQGLRMLFVGDSHTMSGIDDYCAQNRNFLGRGVGFQYCLTLIEKLQPTHLFNCHVNPAFTFTPQEIRFMRETLDEREQRLGALVPWPHANYGLDESWVRCFPYAQQVRAGQRVKLDVIVTNHASQTQATSCRAAIPPAWGGTSTDWTRADVPAKSERSLPLTLAIPAAVPARRYVVPIDVQHGPWDLPQFAEAIVDVS